MKWIRAIQHTVTDFRKMAAGILAGTAAVNTLPVTQPEAKADGPTTPPNIILILADDLGWTDINCRPLKKNPDGTYFKNANGEYEYDSLSTPTEAETYDSTYYQTPNLARLRAEGMRFTNAYAACPFCTPTRASLMTGKYPARLGMTGLPPSGVERWDFQDGTIAGAFSEPAFPKNEQTIAEALHAVDSDYRTAVIGKWHLSGPYAYPSRYAFSPTDPDIGFDYFVGHLGSCYDINSSEVHLYYEWTGPGGVKDSDRYWDRWGLQGMAGAYHAETLWGDPDPKADVNEYLTTSYTIKAIQFLDQVTTSGNDLSGKPFFLFLSHDATHAPYNGDPAFPYNELPQSASPLNSDNQRRYASMIRSLDKSVGDILVWLDQHPEINSRTYVIFYSDNGGVEANNVTRNTPLRGAKTQLYEGGVRVPLIVRGPTIPENRMCDIPVTTADIFPTMMNWAAGTDYVADNYPDIDGVSITPLLDTDPGTTIAREGAIFWHNLYYTPVTDKDGTTSLWPSASVLKDGFKLIKFYDQTYTWPNDFDTTTHQLRQTADASYELYRIFTLALDGEDDYVEITDYPGVTGPDSRTVTAWIRVSNPANYDRRDTIISWGVHTDIGGKWLVRVEENGSGGGVLRAEVQGGYIQGDSSSPNIADGKWHHIAVALQNDGSPDINEAMLYVDGVRISTSPAPCLIDTKDGEVLIGTYLQSNYFNGCIDDVRIYSTALSEDDILALYNDEEVPDKLDNLQASWKFNNNFNDRTNNARHGIVHNTANPFITGERENLYTDNSSAVYYAKSRDLEGLLENWLENSAAKMPMAKVVRLADGELFNSIQAAIDNPLTLEGANISICPGVHKENVSLYKNIILQSINPDDPEVVKNTIIDGVITFNANCTSDCKVQGITIFNSSGSSSGVIGNNSTAELYKCVIRDNKANDGGAINNLDGVISHCRIENNSAAGNGGGFYDCDGTIRNCVVIGNSAAGGGAFYGCGGTIINCTIIGNISTTPTSGALDNCNGTIVNNILWSNYPAQLTSWDTPSYCCIEGISVPNGSNNIADAPSFLNCFAQIDCTTEGVNSGDPSHSEFLFDRIIVADCTPYKEGIKVIEYNNDGVLRKVTGWTDNITGNDIVTFTPPISPETEAGKPVYIWPDGTETVFEDYHLNYTSSCIDAGNPGLNYDGQMDIDGGERVIDLQVDIGADEYSPTACWQFNDSSGVIAKNASERANVGNVKVKSPATFPISPLGRCLQFNANGFIVSDGGTDGVAYCGIEGANARTVSAWINTTQPGDIVSWGQAGQLGGIWVFRIDFDGTLMVGVNGGRIKSAVDFRTPSMAGWHHVAATFENHGTPDVEDVLLYIDGELVTSFKERTPHEINTVLDNNVTIGHWSVFYAGLMDDVRIYRRALSSQQILNLSNGVDVDSANLELHYAFNEATGSAVYDASDNNRDGTLNGGPEWITCEGADSALELNGYEFVDLGSDSTILDNAEAFSISVWVKPNQVPFASHEGIVGFGDSSRRSPWIWGKSGTSKLRAAFYNEVGTVDGSLESTNDLQADTWTHVTVTWDGSTCRLYLNGNQEDFAGTTGTSLVDSNGIKYIGYTSGLNYWNGLLDDLRVYNRALSDIEVSDVVTNNPPSIDLIAHWDFSDIDGYMVSDLCNAYDGVVQPNATWTLGVIGGALQFAGDDYVEVEGYKGVLGSKARTCSAWINTNEHSVEEGAIVSWGRPLAAGGQWRMSVRNGKLMIGVGAGSIIGDQTVNDGGWHHVAAILEDASNPTLANVSIYVDGTLQQINGTPAPTAINTLSGYNVIIGQWFHQDIWANYPYFFKGSIDDVRIYDRALSETELEALAGVNL